jgi:hypothetical protein
MIMTMMGCSSLRTSNIVSLLGNAFAHHWPCVDGFILHVRKLSVLFSVYVLCIFAQELIQRIACLLACVLKLSEHVQVKKKKKQQ